MPSSKRNLMAAGGAVEEYTQNLVENADNNARITGTGATGLTTADQEAWMFSGWIKPEATSGYQYLFHTWNGGAYAVGIFLDGTAIQVVAGGFAPGVSLRGSASGVISTSALQHVLVSVDLSRANADKIQVYVDDVDITMGTITATTGGSVLNGAWGWNTAANGTYRLYNDQQGDFYFALEALDLDTASNRRKFIDASGEPVDLGSDGSTPTGTQPLWFWGGDMDAADWNDGDQLGSDVKTFSSTSSYTDV